MGTFPCSTGFGYPENNVYGEFGYFKRGKVPLFQFYNEPRKEYILKYDDVIYGFMPSKKGFGLEFPFCFGRRCMFYFVQSFQYNHSPHVSMRYKPIKTPGLKGSPPVTPCVFNTYFLLPISYSDAIIPNIFTALDNITSKCT